MRNTVLILGVFALGGSIGYRIALKIKVSVPIVHMDTRQCERNVWGWYFPTSVITLNVLERTPEDVQFSNELKELISKFVVDKDAIIVKTVTKVGP